MTSVINIARETFMLEMGDSYHNVQHESWKFVAKNVTDLTCKLTILY